MLGAAVCNRRFINRGYNPRPKARLARHPGAAVCNRRPEFG